jgi:hypothetical protein
MLDAHQDMNYYKYQKREKQEKEDFKSKYTIVSNSSNREGTESTKDNTFTSSNINQNKNRKESLSSVAEEDVGSSRGTTITSKLEQINEQINFSNSVSSSDSEEAKEDETLSLEMVKSMTTTLSAAQSEEIKGDESEFVNLRPVKSFSHHKLTKNKEDESLNDIKAYRNSLRKSEINQDDIVPRKRIKLPKLLVLVSKYPIYKEMAEFLAKIKSI